jgi:hypothetical protein
VRGTGPASNTARTTPPLDDPLAEVVGEFSLFLCTEPFVDGRAKSTIIVYFGAVLVFARTAEASKWTEGLLGSVKLAISLYQSAECKLTRVWRLDLVAGSSSKQHDRLCSSSAFFVGVNSIVE